MQPLATRQDVAAFLACHINTVDKLRRDDPTFPAPIILGTKAVRWNLADIATWADLAAKSHAPQRRPGRPSTALAILDHPNR